MTKIFSGTESEWDEGVAKNASGFGAFLQSAAWAGVQAKRGNKNVRLVDSAGNPSLWVLLPLKFGLNIWYSAKGPLVLPTENDWSEIIFELKKIQPAALVRFEPPVAPPQIIAGQKIIKHKDVSPAHTLVTALEKTPAELFALFHEKTRYNIRVAERHGVEVRKVSATEALALWPEVRPLYKNTAARHTINSWTDREYTSLMGAADMWCAWQENKIIATSFHLGFGNTMTYLHGASSYEQRAFMAPHLLHWTAMQEARQNGFTKYDWWGIAPPDASSHPLAGVTRFKLGFGGDQISSPGTFEFGIDQTRFRLYTWAQRLRRRS